MASELDININVSNTEHESHQPYVFHCPYCKQNTTLSVVEVQYYVQKLCTLTRGSDGWPYHSRHDLREDSKTEYPELKTIYRCTNCEKIIEAPISDLYFYNLITFKSSSNEPSQE